MNNVLAILYNIRVVYLHNYIIPHLRLVTKMKLLYKLLP